MAENPNLPIGETVCLDSGMAKESRQVLEFTEDITALLCNFKRKWIFEEENFDMMRECLASNGTELIADMKKGPPYDHHAVLRYITQVCNSGVSNLFIFF